MAFIHEQLYQSSDFTNIEFGTYVKNLINYLSYSYSIDSSYINFNLDLDDVSTGYQYSNSMWFNYQ